MLGAFATAPLDTDAARAFLQRRLVFFTKVLAVMVSLFFVVAQIAHWHEPDAVRSTMGTRIVWVQLFMIGSYISVLLRLHRSSRSSRELRRIDTFLTVVPSVLVGYGLQPLSLYLRPELLLVLVMINGLMLRAVVVPSTPKRTLVLSACVSLSVDVATVLFYRNHDDPRLPPTWLYLVMTVTWTTTSTVLTSLISYAIYGLRQKVALASQLGQYTLERQIGQGGMGVVYRASHALLRRPTAIKLLSSAHSNGRDLQRFEREVQLTSQLTHPNTIAIYDYGRTPDGVFYYAMEYLDGLDLQQLVECSGPQPVGCVLRALDQIAGALAEAHSHGLIHRDIKPANVILCERGGMLGVVKVVDFGLAKSLTPSAESPLLSGTQMIMGTPMYLSPEAIARPDDVDARSDLYSLGAVAYYLLAGSAVFNAASIVEICAHHLHTAPEPLPTVPPEVERLVFKLLAKRPADRHASALELQTQLAALRIQHPWTEADARAWWADVQERLALVGDKRELTPLSSHGYSQTLAVDMSLRVPDPDPSSLEST